MIPHQLISLWSTMYGIVEGGIPETEQECGVIETLFLK